MQKIKKFKTAICVLMLALFITTVCTGCSSNKEEKVEATPVVETETTPTTEQATPYTEKATPIVEAKLATVEIAEASDEMLAKYTSYDEFDASIDDYGVRLLLTTDTNVSNLRVFTLKYDEGTQGMVEDTELYQLNELTPDKPLVLMASFPGSMPPIGFEFTDTDGMVKKYDIYMSGMDGSIQLEETTK